MKIIPSGSTPPIIQQTTANTAAASEAKARAVAVLQGKAPAQGQAQETPVANPNAISAEELSAITKPAADPTTTPQAEAAAPATEAPKAPEQPDKASQEWAKLARQERQLRQKAKEQDQKFRQREEAIKAREAEASSKADLYQKGYVSYDKLKNDPLGVLGEAGVSYDEIANQIINPSKIDPRLQAHIDKLQAKIESLEKATMEGNERVTKQQQDSYNAAVKQIEMDVRNLVKSDPNFETVAKTNSTKDVVELITKTYEKDGILLTVEEAANEVENYLIDEAMKLTRIEKIKRRLQPTANSTEVKKTAQTADTKGNAQSQMKTLTNAVSSTRKLSARERALLAFRGELK